MVMRDVLVTGILLSHLALNLLEMDLLLDIHSSRIRRNHLLVSCTSLEEIMSLT